MTDKCVNELALRYLCNSLLTRDVISVLSVQMVVKGKWQGKLLLQNIYMYIIVTLEVVYDHVGKCLKLALCYFIQINLILFWLTTIWNFKKKSCDWNLRISFVNAVKWTIIQRANESFSTFQQKAHMLDRLYVNFYFLTTVQLHFTSF